VFADAFEQRFVHQTRRRSVEETLDLGWELLSAFPDTQLKRIPPDLLASRRTPGAV
jgi:V/A-type H+-transporting ATPase subunit B